MQHPYLFFSRADADAFREKIGTDAAAKERYARATEKAGEYLTEPFVSWEEANGSTTLHGNFGLLSAQADRFCCALGLSYLIEGDRRCAERLKELVGQFIGFERWYSASYVNRKPNPWHSDLISTRTALAMGRIFDLICDSLTPEDRSRLAEGIFEKGVKPALGDWALPESRIHALDSMGHNWWAVCVSEAAIALLAIREHISADADRMLRAADDALAEYLTYPGNPLFNKMRNFDDRGMFYESVNYDNYGTGSLLRYLWCRERCCGRNERIRAALPAGLCDGALCFSYPRTVDGKLRYSSLNFGDSDVDVNVGMLAQYAVKLGIDTSAARALAAACGTDLWDEIAGYDFAALEGSFDALPKTAVYSSGCAVTRDDWAPDSTLLAVKSGYCWNHSHNDAGTFLIFHKGRPFFIDSGTCVYTSPLYHDYYCQNDAHSLLQIGGRGSRAEELYRGTKFPGAIIDRYEGKDFVFFQADATGPAAHLCSRMYRNFLWLDGRMLAIFDDVYTHEADTVQFTLHFDGTYRQENGAILFDNDGMTARLISHTPKMKPEEKIGHVDHGQDEPKPYLSLSDERKERKHLLIHTLELDQQERPASFEQLESADARGVRITVGDTERELWYNHRADGSVMHDNSQNTVADFDTDAYLLMITRDRRAHTERVFAVCCSFLRKDGKVYFSSYKKSTAEITAEGKSNG